MLLTLHCDTLKQGQAVWLPTNLLGSDKLLKQNATSSAVTAVPALSNLLHSKIEGKESITGLIAVRQFAGSVCATTSGIDSILHGFLKCVLH